MKNISHLAPILALAACATVNTGRQETREQLPTTTEVAPNDFWPDDEVDETPDPEMEKLMQKIADEILRAQETVEEMKKAVDELRLPPPPEPIPDEIIPPPSVIP